MAILSSLNSLKVGVRIIYNGEPFIITSARFVKMQQQQPIMQTKIKNLIDGRVLPVTFKSSEKVEEADLERTKASFLYKDEENVNFMDSESYEQFALSLSVLAGKDKYLKDGDEVEILKFQGKPVTLDIPKKITLKVKSAPPGVRGDTASGKVTKEVELENGLKIKTPLFIKEGDSIVVNTETGEYVERA
ncbi:MAG: elongation factor P [Patescibacteria group bacterium]|nr:elongation factor P [Patescibacteria group bacterium]